MAYILRRLRSTLLVVIGVSILIFVLVRLIPGDIVDILAGTEGQISAEQRDEILHDFGLDQPWPVQYGLWVWQMLHGNFGVSFRTQQQVAPLLLARLPLTVELAVLGVLGSALIGIPLGILASVSRSPGTGVTVQIVGLLGLSIPNFWLAVVLILVASFGFHWLPPLFYSKLWENPLLNLQQMALPVISLSVGLAAVVLRMTRSTMLEVMGEEYIKVARAKGLRERVVLLRHALRNALIPIITVLGLQLGYLFGGTVIIEQIFGLPGLGWTLLNGIYQRDYPVIQGSVMLFAVMFALTNLVVDMLYTTLDPRIRL